MTNKDLTKKLSYEELSEELKDLGEDLFWNRRPNYETLILIKDFKAGFFKRYDIYSQEEQRKIMDKLNLIDQVINDSIRIEYYDFVAEKK